MKNTPEYEAWAGMKKRCLNPNFKSYNSYGGRGIKICQTWQNSFEQFYKDMGPRPSFEHSVDRIDNNGDYTPNNCRWATRSEQSRNKSVTRLISFKGKTQCLTDWAKEKGLSKDVLWRRLKAGWSIERALTSPIRTWN